jgi:hypothetical protein
MISMICLWTQEEINQVGSHKAYDRNYSIYGTQIIVIAKKV